MEDKYKTTPENLAQDLYDNAFSSGFYKNAVILGFSPLLAELEKSLKRRGIEIASIPTKKTRLINLDEINLI